MLLILRNGGDQLRCVMTPFPTNNTDTRIMYHHFTVKWRFRDNTDYMKPSITHWIDSTTVILNPLPPFTRNRGLRPMPTEFLPEHNMTAHISGLLCLSGLIYRAVRGTFFYLRATVRNSKGMRIQKNEWVYRYTETGASVPVLKHNSAVSELPF